MGIIRVGDFIQELACWGPQDFDRCEATHPFYNRCIEKEGLEPHFRFRNECYARNLVYRNELYELILITWMPGQRTPIHDHGGGRCWVQILAGELCFKNYEMPKDLEAPFLPKALGGAELYGIGCTDYIDDGIALHTIANVGNEKAASLHLYSRPIERCRKYDERSRQLLWSELTYSF